MNYNDSKTIALDYTKERGYEIDRAYKLGESFVFDNSKVEPVGILPVVVTADGNCKGLWKYLHEADLTMDDMQEIEF